MPNARVPSVTLTCEKCGRLFHPWKKHKPARFCSRACGPRGRQPKAPDHTCEVCGVLFRPTGSRNASRYCSRVCYLAAGQQERKLNAGGYRIVYAKGEPGTFANGQMLEHRLVMQRTIGRPLESHETVHHINGDRTDNRLENLQLRTGRHGKGVVSTCADCGSHNIVGALIG